MNRRRKRKRKHAVTDADVLFVLITGFVLGAMSAGIVDLIYEIVR